MKGTKYELTNFKENAVIDTANDRKEWRTRKGQSSLFFCDWEGLHIIRVFLRLSTIFCGFKKWGGTAER